MRVRSKRPHVAPMALLLAAPWLLNCAAIRLESEGERLFVAGNLPRAAEAFERTLVGSPSARVAEQAHYYLTMIYSTPGSVYDPLESRAHYDRLLATFPSSRYRSYLRPIRSLDDEALRLRAAITEAEAAVGRWNEEARGCRARVSELDDEVDSWLRMSSEELASRRACEQRLVSVRRRIDAREAEIARLHDAVAALEALKRIDTEPGG